MKPSPWSKSRIAPAVFIGVAAVLVALLVAVLFAGCDATPSTVLTGASVRQGNSFSSLTPVDPVIAHKRHTSITIAPATQPASTTQPTTVQVDDKTLVAPAGTSVTYTSDTEDTQTAGQPGKVTEENHADAAGASISTNGDKGNITWDAPKVDVNPVSVSGFDGTGTRGGGGHSAGGGTTFSWVKVIQQALASSKGELWLWAIGAGVMLLAWGYAAVERIIPGGKIDWELVIIAQVVGLGFIATALTAQEHPGVFVFLFLAIVAGIVWYVWSWSKKNLPLSPAGTSASLATEAESEAVKLAASMGLHVGGAAAPAAPATPTAAAPPAK